MQLIFTEQCKDGDYYILFGRSTDVIPDTLTPSQLVNLLECRKIILRCVKYNFNEKSYSYFTGHSKFNLEDYSWIPTDFVFNNRYRLIVADEVELTELKLRNILM